MTVAAWVGPVSSWENFDKLWLACREQAGIKRFHMTDYIARQREYGCWPEQKRHIIIDDLLALIVQTVRYGVSISIHLEQFEKLWPENHPYIFSAAQCISLMAMRLKEHGIEEEISYIYDDGDERGGQFREAMSDVLGLGERYRQMFTAHAIAPGSGVTWLGLDAADYLAWTGGYVSGYY